VSNEHTKSNQAAWLESVAPDEFIGGDLNSISVQEICDCPVCGNRSFEQYAIGFDYELQTCSNSWRFVKCTECNHVWLHPRPALKELSVIYPPTYYAYSFEDQVNPIALFAKQVIDRRKIHSIVKALGRQLSSYLDIGCGSGRFLRVLEKQGLSREVLYGLELDAAIVDKLSAEGYQVFGERVEQSTAIPQGRIDLATMFHVIEHVDDPGSVVARVFEWLAPNGIFAIETPNIDSFDARLFKRTFWGGYHVPRHWNLFSPESLRRLLEDK